MTRPDAAVPTKETCPCNAAVSVNRVCLPSGHQLGLPAAVLGSCYLILNGASVLMLGRRAMRKQLHSGKCQQYLGREERHLHMVLKSMFDKATSSVAGELPFMHRNISGTAERRCSAIWTDLPGLHLAGAVNQRLAVGGEALVQSVFFHLKKEDSAHRMLACWEKSG